MPPPPACSCQILLWARQNLTAVTATGCSFVDPAAHHMMSCFRILQLLIRGHGVPSYTRCVSFRQSAFELASPTPMTVLDSECNVCFEEKSKYDHRKGKMFSSWEKAAAKDDTEPHVDRGHPEQNPPQFLLCSPPSGILSPVDYTSFVSRGTHSTPPPGPCTKVEFP